MTIKGTLETFNLRELLQMLSFNQKVGTLVLETVDGPRTIHVDRGGVAFVSGDLAATRSLERVLRRREILAPDRLERGLQLHRASGKYLGELLLALGSVDEEVMAAAGRKAMEERFLTLTLTSVTHFEFLDGATVAPDGSQGTPLEPRLPVESLLLDLTRKMDQWRELCEEVPGLVEVYEGTGLGVDLVEVLGESEVEVQYADRVVSSIDGYRTLAQVVEACDVDELSTVEIVAALLRGGGLRPVSTEDLLARGEDLLTRGEAEPALPLFVRAIERGDAPIDGRLRLADALEATGRPEEAATELETFAALAQDTQPRVVFRALRQAHELRGGELAAAMRVCDYYLRNRPWLREEQDDALQLLRALIHTAVTDRRPLEAARRLASFIQEGDATSDDLPVLADLFAAGGEPGEAATALYRRAEDLLAAGRTGPGRDLLRRCLQLDGSRADARARLLALEGEQRRSRRVRRYVVTALCLIVVIGGAGIAWWSYNQEARRSMRLLRSRAEEAVSSAESSTDERIRRFRRHAARAARGDETGEGLGQAAAELRKAAMEEFRLASKAVVTFASEMDGYQGPTDERGNGLILQHMDGRLKRARQAAENAIDAARNQGLAALSEGEAHLKAGQFEATAEQLSLARRLSFDDAAMESRIDLLEGHVASYVRSFEAAWPDFERARTAGNVEVTYRLGTQMLQDLLDSDFTRRIRLPVRVVTDPPGAELLIEGTEIVGRSPTILEYSPFEPCRLTMRMPGRVPQHFPLPSYEDLLRAPDSVLDWSPNLRATLPVGAWWRIPPEAGPFSGLWPSEDVPVLLVADGSAWQPVAVSEGRLGMRRSFRRPAPARAAGVLSNGVEWRILGSHTLLIRPVNGTPWERQVLGRLTRPPAALQDLVAVVDEDGRVYGLDTKDGTERWTHRLDSPPAQRPMASRLGVLVATVRGAVKAIDPATGTVRTLVTPVGRHALALPLGDGAVVVGGGTGEAHLLARGGGQRRLGEAHPVEGRTPWISQDGVAWIGASGVRWVAADSSIAVAVTGLGVDVAGLSGADGVLYAVSSNGTVRAARPDHPEETLWEVHLDGSPGAPPMPLGSMLFVLVDGGLAAIAR